MKILNIFILAALIGCNQSQGTHGQGVSAQDALGTWLFDDTTVKQFGTDVRILTKLKLEANLVSNVTECSTADSRVVVRASGAAEITDTQIIVKKAASNVKYLDVAGNIFACVANVIVETDDYQMDGTDKMVLKDPSGQEKEMTRTE